MEARRKGSAETELIVDDINWTQGVGRPAGVYWLNGVTLIAAYGSPAEARLQCDGAVLVATLRFDADPRERVHRSGHVHEMNAAVAARDLFASSVN